MNRMTVLLQLRRGEIATRLAPLAAVYQVELSVEPPASMLQ